MKVILKTRAHRSLCSPTKGAVRRRFIPVILSGFLYTACWLVIDSSYAEIITAELSPLAANSTLVAPVDGNKQISVMLALPSSDPAGLAEFVHHVSTQGDPLYHQYITPQQFAERFGGNSDDYAYLKNWALGNGLQISQESVGRVNLVINGSVSELQKIFKTQLNTYRATDGQIFYSASVKPSIPNEIASRVSGFIGLTSGKPLAPHVKVAKTLGEDPMVRSDQMRTDSAGGTGPGGTYSAKDLRTAYSLPSFGSLSKNMVIAVFEQGGYKISDTDVYFKKNDLPRVKQTSIAVNNSVIQVEPDVELEACLDVDTVVGINPDISEVLVYIDDFNHDPLDVAIPAALTLVADDNKAQILSISYGQAEGYQGDSAMNAENTALQQCAAEGITVLASSGDDGAYGDGPKEPYNVSDPASQPYVMGVGGTSLFTGPGDVYIDEAAWNDFALIGIEVTGGATGGGISSYWSITNNQLPQPGYTTVNGGSATMRNVPDVAAVGDPRTGVAVYVKDQGGWIQVGGTSLSCPIWAGYLSTINAAFSYAGMGNLGFVNPDLYDLGAQFFSLLIPWLYEVPQGTNGFWIYGPPGYSNGGGYSNTTGNGSLWGSQLASQLLISQSQPGTPPRTFWYTTRKLSSTGAEINWAPSVGADAYVMLLYHESDYGYPIAQAYLTKTTKLKIDGLTPKTSYTLECWSFNASGSFGSIVADFKTSK